MQTPEEFVQARNGECAREWGSFWCTRHESRWPETAQACHEVTDLADLVEQYGDEVRAETLAGFTEERKDRRSCGCRVPVNAVWSCCFSAGHTVAIERRLVGPWEPAP